MGEDNNYTLLYEENNQQTLFEIFKEAVIISRRKLVVNRINISVL